MTTNNKNRHGLSRHIPEDIKHKIRQNSKFGCVVPNCRNSFYEYEHLLPEFKDAKSHDPDKICLTCPNHNPRRIGTNGQSNYSKEQLISFYDAIKSADKVPDIINHDFFSGFKAPLEIKIGQSIFSNIDTIINIDGEDVLSFSHTPNPMQFEPEVMFSGVFKKQNGTTLFKIINNEWISKTDLWDIKTTNGSIEIIDSYKEIVFQAYKIPQKNMIEITKLNLWYNPFHVYIENSNLFVGRVSIKEEKHIYLNINARFEHAKCGIYLTKEKMKTELCDYGFEFSGNTGSTLIGNGIFFPKGGGRTLISSIKIFKSENVEEKQGHNFQKTEVPEGGNYFVYGILQEKIIQYPRWTETEYWLNGQQISSRPNSWGVIDEDGRELFHISRDERADFSKNSGFIGFYANDLLGTRFQDKVFEIIVEMFDEFGSPHHKRIKRFEKSQSKVISEYNPSTLMYYHPQEFGMSPWKKG